MHELLNATSLANGLPISYRSDLTADAELILQHPEGTEFAWLLKEAGTVIMPLCCGVPPISIEFWLDQGGKQSYFHIKGNSVTQVSAQKLKHLIHQMPTDISESGVNRILEMRHWGMFHKPTFPAERSAWGEWRNWFISHKHDLMANYLDRAIRLNQKAA